MMWRMSAVFLRHSVFSSFLFKVAFFSCCPAFQLELQQSWTKNGCYCSKGWYRIQLLFFLGWSRKSWGTVPWVRILWIIVVARRGIAWRGEYIGMLQLGENATSIRIYSFSKGPTPSLPQQETLADAVVCQAMLAAWSSKAYLSGTWWQQCVEWFRLLISL